MNIIHKRYTRAKACKRMKKIARKKVNTTNTKLCKKNITKKSRTMDKNNQARSNAMLARRQNADAGTTLNSIKMALKESYLKFSPTF